MVSNLWCEMKLLCIIGCLIRIVSSFIIHPTTHIRTGYYNTICNRYTNINNILQNADGHQDHQSMSSSCTTLLTDFNSELQGLDYCDDIDKAQENLISPAPESFHVIHTAISKLNKELGNISDGHNHCNDLKALSSYLLKPNVKIELYISGVIRWRVVPCSCNESNKVLIINCGYIADDCRVELYHDYNPLQLSKMAIDLGTNDRNNNSSKIQDIACQAEKRLALTLGTDLRGNTSADASFNFAVAGVCSQSLFETLCCIGIYELQRTGRRNSFKPRQLLHMVEKFAASDIQGQYAKDLYSVVGDILDEKRFDDNRLISDLKAGNYGLHSTRPLIWLWRFSSRQKKVKLSNADVSERVNWAEIFRDSSKPLVIDLGSGMGTSLLNLSTLTSDRIDSLGDDELQQMSWSCYNFAGADLNQAFVNFANGVVARDTTRMGRVHFLPLPAAQFLHEIKSYPGPLAFVMINFPSPYRLEVGTAGNLQLPSKHSDHFMVSDRVLTLIDELLANSNAKEEHDGIFLFQTKCEDVAVHVKNKCLSLTSLECVPCKYPVKDIEHEYKNGVRPKRVDEWLKQSTSIERAEGNIYSRTPILPRVGMPETEIQCLIENTVVHRLLFKRNI